VAACTVLVALGIHYNIVDARGFDRVIDWTSSATDLNLNGVFALLIVIPLATTVFARRRYKEAINVRKELVRLSLHDALTGLPNRMLLADWLAADIQTSQRHNSQAAVLFVDLDKFKHVNDTHGHEVGDRLMRSVADRLRTMLRPEDRIIRYRRRRVRRAVPGREQRRRGREGGEPGHRDHRAALHHRR
jgi:predicted signal transduction protein with EAL and GGDEF domain